MIICEQITVEQEGIDRVRNMYAPRDLDVFQLVPPDFNVIITQIYAEAGHPAVTWDSCWDVYLTLLRRLEALLLRDAIDINDRWGYTLTQAQDDCVNEIELLPDLEELRGGESVIGPYYMGGVNNGDGLGLDSPFLGDF